MSEAELITGDGSDGLEEFAADIADQIQSFVLAVTEVAKAESPDQAVSLLLLEVSQLMLAGGRLGAIVDVVPDDRFEPDTGFDPDIDVLREKLAVLLEPIDTSDWTTDNLNTIVADVRQLFVDTLEKWPS